MFSSRIPWVILLLFWMAGSTWWHVCNIKFLCADSPSPTLTNAPAPVATIPTLSIKDGEKFLYTPVGNFSFAKSGAVANQTGVGSLLDSLSSYIKTNPGKKLTIKGFYSSAEQNTTTFANLGLARAAGIKQSFIKLGIPDKLLNTEGILSDSLAFSAKGDSIYGGLDFNFNSFSPVPSATPSPVTPTDKPVTEDALAEKEKFTSVFKPIDLYFHSGEINFIKTGETTKFFSEAMTYLAQNKDKKLVLTGHTDSSGPDAVNLQLSRDRANSVKLQLRKSGINSTQIRVEAKGETDPKADNKTPAGRVANRRVTVVVQ